MRCTVFLLHKLKSVLLTTHRLTVILYQNEIKISDNDSTYSSDVAAYI